MFVKGLGQQETHFMKHHLENFALQTLIKQFDQKEMINGINKCFHFQRCSKSQVRKVACVVNKWNAHQQQFDLNKKMSFADVLCLPKTWTNRDSNEMTHVPDIFQKTNLTTMIKHGVWEGPWHTYEETEIKSLVHMSYLVLQYIFTLQFCIHFSSGFLSNNSKTVGQP